MALLLALGFGSVRSQDSSLTGIEVNFHVPRNWRKVNDSVFVRTNYAQELARMSTALSEGHQPWRFEPANVAAACMWEFGITDSSTVLDFAERLTEIRHNEIYSVTTSSAEYIVHTRTKKKTLVAFRFEVRHR